MTVEAFDFTSASASEFREALVMWIENNCRALTPPYHDHGSTSEVIGHQRSVQAFLFDEGWMRWGWPKTVGGYGGSPLFRAILGEELTARGLVHSAAFSMTEVLGPAVIKFAHARLSALVVPKLLRGDEWWCQGFSEPEAGSDLGSLRTAAIQEGDSWILTGQKLWTSWAHHSTRCVVLARTEGKDSGSKGITAFFVDVDSPGITIRPIQTMAEVDEFCEVFFDDVRVPHDRIIGGRGNGWAVTQYILACERGPIFWQRGSWMLYHLGQIAAIASPHDQSAHRLLGQAYADILALRARSRITQNKVAEGELRGADSSLDKILIAAADQSTFDAARQILDGGIEFGDSDEFDRFRKEWLYSRAASIYGGTSEIQRDIVALRLLNMPRGE
jgi:alkylation response protein AidB-like acyl-CoA dehydrogenase